MRNMSSFRDRSCWCKRACAEIADVAYLRDNRLSDPSFRRDGPRGQRIVAYRRQRDVEDSVLERPQNRTQVVESQAFTCRNQLALFCNSFVRTLSSPGLGLPSGILFACVNQCHHRGALHFAQPPASGAGRGSSSPAGTTVTVQQIDKERMGTNRDQRSYFSICARWRGLVPET